MPRGGRHRRPRGEQPRYGYEGVLLEPRHGRRWRRTHHDVPGCGHPNDSHGDYGECHDCMNSVPPGPCAEGEEWVFPAVP